MVYEEKVLHPRKQEVNWKQHPSAFDLFPCLLFLVGLGINLGATVWEASDLPLSYGLSSAPFLRAGKRSVNVEAESKRRSRSGRVRPQGSMVPWEQCGFSPKS